MLDEIGQDGVRSRRFSIGSRGSTSSALEARVNSIHDVLDCGDMFLRKIGNLHPSARVLSAFDFGSLVQKVEQLTAIDLVE